MPKHPSINDFDIASEWLDVNEGDNGEKESCHRVAEWLRHQSDLRGKKLEDVTLTRELVAKTGISTKQARDFLRQHRRPAGSQ